MYHDLFNAHYGYNVYWKLIVNHQGNVMWNTYCLLRWIVSCAVMEATPFNTHWSTNGVGVVQLRESP